MIDRRKFIATTATVAATAALSKIALAGNEEGRSAHSSHQKHQHGVDNTPEAALAVAASNCVTKGEACLQHCMDSLASGDTSMANCSKSVREMLVYCNALSKAAVQNSKHLKQLAKIAMETCKECETACRQHADKHAVCKACADSCAECMKQCKSIAA
jgi:Cys-rich four helix bundle protein (predicted Tat secretion target)